MESEKKSILCVDDNRDTLELFNYFFKQEGFEVCACQSLEECLSEVRKNEFSAIILDNRFDSGTNSLEVCREIRSFNPRVPIIFCSGESREPEIKKALEAGGDLYLVKPLDFDNLTEAVENLIDETQAKRVNSRSNQVGV